MCLKSNISQLKIWRYFYHLKMHPILEIVVTLLVILKSTIQHLFYCIIPPRRKSVQNERVLITGAGSGLGRLMCIEFSKRGAEVIACDINTASNKETAQLITEKGGKIHTYTCDVSKKEEIYKLAERVQEDVGQVDILVNNAGIVSGKSILDIPDNMVQKTIDINLMAHFWTIKSFLPSMKARNHGHIVTIASAAGHFGSPKMTDYCASKFANMGLVESLMYELRAEGVSGVHLTTVCPYVIDTGMFSGCKSRFEFILPVLQPDYVVERIMHAVLTNQSHLFIPRTFHILNVLKACLPVEATVALNKFFGGFQFMDTFVGRQNQKKVN